MFLVNPKSKQPLYEQLVEQLRRQLILGVVEAGTALPSVRQLATELGLNPNTVQKAYRLCFAAYLRASEDSPRYVHRKIPVSAERRGKPIRKKRRRQYQYRPEALRLRLEAPERENSHCADSHAEKQTEEKLREHKQSKRARSLALHERQRDHREHIGERVVTAAFHLKQRR